MQPSKRLEKFGNEYVWKGETARKNASSFFFWIFCILFQESFYYLFDSAYPSGKFFAVVAFHVKFETQFLTSPLLVYKYLLFQESFSLSILHFFFPTYKSNPTLRWFTIHVWLNHSSMWMHIWYVQLIQWSLHLYF